MNRAEYADRTMIAVATTVPNSVPTQRTAPRALERYFQTSLFLLIVTGFATLASTGKLDMFSVFFVSCALFYRAAQLVLNRSGKIPERITSFLGLIYLLIYVVDFFLLSRTFVSSTVHLLLFGMVVKIFSVQRERDHTYLAVLAFLEVLSAALLTVDSVFLAAFTVFLLVAVATFISMEMRRSAIAAGALQRVEPTPVQRRRRLANLRSMDASLSTTSAALVCGIILLGSVLFFLMPRLSGGYLSKLAQQNSFTSGFSDSVLLGEIGRIQQSSQVAMHVRIGDRSRIPEIRMRGTSLSSFDGRHWFNPPHPSELLSHNSGRYDFASDTRSLSRPLTRFAAGPTRRVVQYRVVMEPIGTNVVFLITVPRLVFADFREVIIDFGEAMQNTDQERTTSAYTGLSDLSQPLPENLRKDRGDYDDEVERRYLQLPVLDPRVVKLAHDTMAQQPNAYDKAIAVQRYLAANFTYTLELPSERQSDPLAFFLLERKKGHCEYFASAMAILLRVEGIPTRIVTGFRGGEYNDLTGEYIVRARDAHSWVEVYFPDYGWVTFDPTAASTAPEASTWSRFMLYTDAAREFWREWVINYDFSHQKTMSEIAASSGREHVDRLRNWFHKKYEHLLLWARLTHARATHSPWQFSSVAILLMCAIAVLANLGRIYRSIVQLGLIADPGRSPGNAASFWYSRLTHTLSRKGYPKKPSQTPIEFALSIEEPSLRERVEIFTVHYERARFGNSAEDAVKLPELYKGAVETK